MEKTTASAKWRGGVAFSVRVGDHEVISDLPQEKGGQDAGPTPPQLVVGALAACTGMFAKLFTDREGLAAEGIEAVAEAETLQSPARLDNFSVQLTFPSLPAGKRDRARAFVEACLVGHTLKAGASVNLKLA
ncbi:MAG: OsmC family protein [Candidatus Bipolaricaulaceae bacterium]